MICGQIEPLYYDEDLDVEYYSDDPEHDTMDFWFHDFEFASGKMRLHACGECSTLDDQTMFSRWQERVRAGEIPFIH